MVYDKEKYFSVSELTAYLNLSHGKVYKMLRLPGFPKIQKGRMYLIDKKKFFAWQSSYEGTYM